MLSGGNVDFRRRVVNDAGLRAQNQTTSGQSTKKLFKAIQFQGTDDERVTPEEALNHFQQALQEGADVNAFNEEGMTPLISIIYDLSAGSETEEEKEYQSMIRLLLLHRSIDVNIQKKGDGNTALHLAMSFQQRKVLQLLLSHPRIMMYLLNKRLQDPEECAKKNRAEHLIIEIQKAETGKQLLNALSNRNIDRAKRLLNQELNPNCWKRNSNGEIETPLSLIIKSCLQGITEENKKEVLTKFLKHKDLDFSQIKPIPAIEQNSRLKQIIEQAMKERLTDAINRKDLDDIKKLVEDNCFMNDQIVIELLKSFNPVREYLNGKFPATVEQSSANVHNVAPEINDDLIAQELQQLENLRNELERTKAQLTEKEQELNRVVSERTRDTDKISQLERDLRQERLELQAQNQDSKNKNRKLSEASIYNRRQSNYASASFVLSGAFAVGTSLTMVHLAMCVSLAVAALTFLAVGCYCSYNANTALNNVEIENGSYRIAA
ncbi:TomO hydrophobic C-terminal domain-containing protein [Wolbachia endosymbiont (group B) of Philonthus cognatus]|uniref:TomO hydrophobic C-terminal domain-containing protein n=1 Tax=Wolbachia endosymbiont (group B) of Philonthus cognatus TaxID=2954047 RepID=UPI00222038B6|nr:ankyrin repeat domain-containing protein [Wolbachia endosymbiont (group B) of Philonthus cognatus]